MARQIHTIQDQGANVDLFLANPCEQDFGQAGRAGEGGHDHVGQSKHCIENQSCSHPNVFQLAIDDDSNQTAQMTASILNWPQV